MAFRGSTRAPVDITTASRELVTYSNDFRGIAIVGGAIKV